MRYQIDTIPVWDAVNEHSECPFCLLQSKMEDRHVNYYLGDSVMQSHIRLRVNKTGFCAHHYQEMLKSDRKLSLGLMCTTHTEHILSEIKAPLDALKNSNGNSKETKAIANLIEQIEDINDKCVICEDIEYDIQRYLHTFIYLYKKDPKFIKELDNSKGFCLNHFAKLLAVAQKQLSGKKRNEFISIIIDIQTSNMERLTDEVKWFCDKFDYRHMDKPWKNSRDSLPRILIKLGGKENGVIF